MGKDFNDKKRGGGDSREQSLLCSTGKGPGVACRSSSPHGCRGLSEWLMGGNETGRSDPLGPSRLRTFEILRQTGSNWWVLNWSGGLGTEVQTDLRYEVAEVGEVFWITEATGLKPFVLETT